MLWQLGGGTTRSSIIEGRNTPLVNTLMPSHFKKITHAQIIGQRAINLVEQRILEMGFLWYATGGLEAGIDGTIEIRDDATGEVLNNIVQVQSKGTEGPFPAETADSFEWPCAERDLDYWTHGNSPVVLVVARPRTNEAYWVSVKDYFGDPARKHARKVRFDKIRDRFDAACKGALLELSISRDSGLYLAPPPQIETLYSNLLPISDFASTLFLADTDCRQREDVWHAMDRLDLRPGGEFVLSDKRILSVHDLREHPWNQICDAGTVEEFATDEWASADEPGRRREFVRLLNGCLRERCWPNFVRYNHTRDLYYFAATKQLDPRTYRYRSAKVRTSREVFRGYPIDDPYYYRHSAFEGHFRRFEGDWFLQITPTYYFSYNGYDEDRNADVYLGGIKRLERNDAVAGQLLMWAEFLGPKGDLFTPEYPHLSFGHLAFFEASAGIDDAVWTAREVVSDEQFTEEGRLEDEQFGPDSNQLGFELP
jgi:Domain of unknown function (DUF4365)